MRRRHFVLGTAAAVAAVGSGAAAYWKLFQPRELRFGLVGLGRRGKGLFHTLKNDLNFGAICDVNRPRIETFRQEVADGIPAYQDFREMLAREDIHAVVVAAPDHWHARIAIAAMQSGKDVYCEKPMAYSVVEGREMIDAVAKTNRTVQIGTQRRNDPVFRQACRLIREGTLGELEMISVQLPPVSYTDVLPLVPAPVPDGLDWNLWLGPAPHAEYCEERYDYNWRWFYEYSGGRLLGWGSHLMDIVLWALPEESRQVSSVEGQGEFPNVEHGYNTPRYFDVTYRFAHGLVVNVNNRGQLTDERAGILFQGSESDLFISWWELRGRLADQLPDVPADLNERRVSAVRAHVRNFIECIRTGELPASDVESQHQATTLCHLGNIAVRLGRRLEWDAQAETFGSDEEANRMLSPTRRDAAAYPRSPQRPADATA